MSYPLTGDGPIPNPLPPTLDDMQAAHEYELRKALDYDGALTFPLPDDWEDYADEYTDEDEAEWQNSTYEPYWLRPMTTVYLPGDAP